MNSEHPQDETIDFFQCLECEFEADNEPSMEAHVILCHRKRDSNSELPCRLCSSTCQTRASLLAHYKNAHVSQDLETADTADNEDVNSNLKEDYRKLKIH